MAEDRSPARDQGLLVAKLATAVVCICGLVLTASALWPITRGEFGPMQWGAAGGAIFALVVLGWLFRLRHRA